MRFRSLFLMCLVATAWSWAGCSTQVSDATSEASGAASAARPIVDPPFPTCRPLSELKLRCTDDVVPTAKRDLLSRLASTHGVAGGGLGFPNLLDDVSSDDAETLCNDQGHETWFGGLFQVAERFSVAPTFRFAWSNDLRQGRCAPGSTLDAIVQAQSGKQGRWDCGGNINGQYFCSCVTSTTACQGHFTPSPRSGSCTCPNG